MWQTEGVRVDKRSQFKEMLTKNALVPWKVGFEYEEVKKAEVDKHCQQDKEPNIRAVILTGQGVLFSWQILVLYVHIKKVTFSPYYSTKMYSYYVCMYSIYLL